MATIALCAVATSPIRASAQGPAAPTFATSVALWGLQEIGLRSDIPHGNPFQDVSLQATFSCGGQTITTDGFYDGDGQWKVRLMPDRLGVCRFRTRSNDKRLDGQSGRFRVVAAGPGNHGPVRVAKTCHFSHADGTPYFPLGTTAYNWLNRDPVLEERTLTTLAKNPFNKLRFGIFPKWYQFNRVEPPRFPYARTGGKLDFERFDPAFFQHFESRLRDLQRLGIEAEIILFHPYDKWGFAKMDASHDEAYVRYVAARFSAFRNVWWTMANEFNMFDERGGAGLKTKNWDHLFEVLHAHDPYRHLTGMHNGGAWYDHRKPWITHVEAQEQTRFAHWVAYARETYAKPVIIEEYAYEGTGFAWAGDLTGPAMVSRHWDITMAGGYGSHGETYVQPGAVMWWSAGGELVGDSPPRLGFLKTVMSQLPFQDMVPANEIVMGGTALAKKGDSYLFRFAQFPAAPPQIRTDGSGIYKVELIDPWLMKIYPLGVTRAGTQAFKLFMAPYLLRLTRIDAVQTGLPLGSIQELISAFLDDSTSPQAPEIRPFTRDVEYYSLEYSIATLLADPRTRELVAQHMPEWIELARKRPRMADMPANFQQVAAPFFGLPIQGTPSDYGSRLNALAGGLATIRVKP